MSANIKRYSSFRNHSINNSIFRSTHLCVINDSDFIREGLLALLKKTPGIASTTGFEHDEFLSYNDHHEYSIIVTEIEYSNAINPDYLKHIRTAYPDSKIIVYTNFKNSNYKNMAINAGADFFLFMEDKYNLLEHLVAGILRLSGLKS